MYKNVQTDNSNEMRKWFSGKVLVSCTVSKFIYTICLQFVVMRKEIYYFCFYDWQHCFNVKLWKAILSNFRITSINFFFRILGLLMQHNDVTS